MVGAQLYRRGAGSPANAGLGLRSLRASRWHPKPSQQPVAVLDWGIKSEGPAPGSPGVFVELSLHGTQKPACGGAGGLPFNFSLAVENNHTPEVSRGRVVYHSIVLITSLNIASGRLTLFSVSQIPRARSGRVW